jgi:beta-lactamase class A
MLTRRQLLRGIALGAATATLRMLPARAAVTHPALYAQFARIEAQTGGRLGIAAWDTHSGWRTGYRAAQRFPLCSTWKLLAVAAVLRCADTGHADLARRIYYTADNLVTYSPITREHAGASGMTLRELCAAALVWSDNSAGNLLLAALGGSAARPPSPASRARWAIA